MYLYTLKILFAEPSRSQFAKLKFVCIFTKIYSLLFRIFSTPFAAIGFASAEISYCVTLCIRLVCIWEGLGTALIYGVKLLGLMSDEASAFFLI